MKQFLLSCLILALCMSLVAVSDSVDYSEAPYIGKWGNIIVEHRPDESAREGMVLRARPQALGDNFWDWGIQTKGSQLIEVNPGSTYDISFRMRAADPRGIFFKCVATDLGSGGSEVEYFGGWVSPEISEEWQTYTYEDVTIVNETKAALWLQWMGADDLTMFYIDDLQVIFDSSHYVPVEDIAISSCPEVVVSERIQMSAMVWPDTASNKSYTWSTSNDSIAMITVDGELIPRRSGQVSIIARSDDGGMTDSCHMEVVLQHEARYVSMDGNDDNPGSSEAVAWRTLKRAFDGIRPGDTLFIGDGIYAENDLVIRNLVADSSAWTVVRSIHPLGAAIRTTGLWVGGLGIRNCAYLEVDGLEVYHADQIGKGAGITVEAGSDIPMSAHHITIRNCYVHDMGCGGIGTHTAGDYLLFENNVVRDNAKRSEYNCSGISIYHPVAIDTLPGYHIIIRGNVAFENECDLPFIPGGFNKPTDGNGIIVDDLHFSQDVSHPAYEQDILIENNLSFNNGGRGINIYKSDHVTVRNNTCWHNMRILSKYDQKDDVRFGESRASSFHNNLVVVNDSILNRAFGTYNVSADMAVYHNLFVGHAQLGSGFDKQGNKSVPDHAQDYPRFRNPTTEVAFSHISDFRSYFGLEPGSPAADAGTELHMAAFDLDGLPRPTCGGPDMGAYEYTDTLNYVPRLFIHSPDPEVEIDMGEVLDIDVESTDCDGSVEGLELYRNDTLVQEADGDSHVFVVEDLSAGLHEFLVLAYDDYGEAGYSDPIYVLVKDTSTVSLMQETVMDVLVYPNPAGRQLSIRGWEGGSLKLTDMQGREVLIRKNCSDLEQLDVGMLPRGSYILQLQMGDQRLFRKVILTGTSPASPS